MVRENIRFNAIGRIQDLPNSVQGLLFETMAQTSQNDGMTFTLALSYGSRMEIIDAVQRLTYAVQRGNCTPRRLLRRYSTISCIQLGCPIQIS